MDRLLPIVPGCKTVIVNSGPEQLGMEVGVICRVEDVDLYKPLFFKLSDKIWKTEESIMYTDFLGNVRRLNIIEEHRLMRIDGNEELFKAEEREVEKDLIK
jgi:hypothetical protein